MVIDINPYGASSNPSQFKVVGNTLFFIADGGRQGVGLWKSDGTKDGTQMVRKF